MLCSNKLLPRSWLIGVLVIGAFACGDDGVTADDEETGDGDGDPTGDGDGDGDPTGDGDGDPTGDGDGDPTGDGDGDPTGDGDGDPTGDGDGDPTGDGDGDPTGDGDGDGDGVSYSAEAFFGGLDRVFVYRHDYDNDTCARMSIVSPEIGQFNVITPGSWSVEHVSVYNGADCPPEQPYAWATSGTGIVDFVSLDMMGYFPCELDVDAQFDLDTDPVTMVSFTVEGLPVGGAEC